MKLWFGYGSEHSMNLVLIGQFQGAGEARAAKQAIDQLSEAVRADQEANRLEIGKHSDRFTDEALELLRQVKFYDVRPDELEQFVSDVAVTLEDNRLILTTEESDVSAFIKLLVDKGAKIEIFSAHHYPESPYGRGK